MSVQFGGRREVLDGALLMLEAKSLTECYHTFEPMRQGCLNLSVVKPILNPSPT